MKPSPLPFRQIVLAIGLISAPVAAEQNVRDTQILQRDLGIPTSIARVVEGSVGARQLPDYILIQDVHRHPEAQGNISALLLYGSRQWGLRDVFLEGARANENVVPMDGSRYGELRQAVLEGKIGGAEMAAALLSPPTIALSGLEEAELYRSHVSVYERAEDLRPAALRQLSMNRLFKSGFDVHGIKNSPADVDLLKKLIQLRLKPGDYQAYLSRASADSSNAILAEALRTAELFYVLADERSRVFTDVLLDHASPGPQAAIVGGFHTEKMAEELRRRGRSYVVLSPQITTSGYDDLYARGMQQTISALKVGASLSTVR